VIEGNHPIKVHITELNQINFDLELYLSWLQNVYENNFIETAHANYTLSDLERYLETRINNPEIKFWGIFLESQKFIGTIKLEPINWKNQTAWLGMMIGDSSERGKGFGYQALNLVLDYAERFLHLKAIFLGVHKDNTPAIKIYKKSGFEIYTVHDSKIDMKKELKTPNGL
jgi:RimJ/RimL family protein N-acetyltransferase